MEKRIYLVRHGDVEASSGAFLGWTDVSLSPKGRLQGNRLAERLRAAKIDRCFCSPLRRARQTAELIVENRDIEIEIHECLKEIHFGRWEGLNFNEVVRQDPEEAQGWCDSPLDFTFPEGDSVAVFIENLKSDLQWLKAQDGETLLLVTHAGVIRVLLTLLLDLRPADQFKFEVERGSLSCVKLFGSDAVLTGLNDYE